MQLGAGARVEGVAEFEEGVQDAVAQGVGRVDGFLEGEVGILVLKDADEAAVVFAAFRLLVAGEEFVVELDDGHGGLGGGDRGGRVDLVGGDVNAGGDFDHGGHGGTGAVGVPEREVVLEDGRVAVRCKEASWTTPRA